VKLEVAPEAALEFEAAAAWYERERAGLGTEFVAEVDDALARILEAPDAFPVVHASVEARRLRLRRFPYSIIYRRRGEVIRVLAFAHTKPGAVLLAAPHVGCALAQTKTCHTRYASALYSAYAWSAEVESARG
jgi:plasmid stabilization system protein ParE